MLNITVWELIMRIEKAKFNYHKKVNQSILGKMSREKLVIDSRGE
ncbi:MAG: hypothetical protein AB4080_23605 [Trichodesmium sp.]